jgi:cell pole-organizing protein PopZ
VILEVFDLDAAMGSSSLKVNEPSMEDILASIRRIISDDDQEVISPSEFQEPGSSPLKNVLDIAERHVSPLIGTGPNESLLGPWSRGDAAFTETHPEAGFEPDWKGFDAPEDPAPAPIVVPEPVLKAAAKRTPSPADSLLSREASASVSGAFSRLSETVKPAQPQTVEDLMKEMLRPMLKTWLDDNLPSLVERLVRAEIERVTRSRG